MRNSGRNRALALKRAIAVILATLLVLQVPSTAQVVTPAIPAVVLGGVLDQLEARVDRLINDARNAGADLALVIGSQVAAQIALARQQLHTELELQRAEWQATTAQLIDTLTKSVEELEQKAIADAEDLANQTALIALSLPFHDSTPHVRAFSPQIAFKPPTGVDDLVFTVAGVFPQVGVEDGFEPTLALEITGADGRPLPAFQPSYATAFSAQFHVPKTNFAFPTGSAARAIKGHVAIPYKKSCAVVFRCRTEAKFPVLIGLLPSSPGNLHVTFTNTTEDYSTQLNTSWVMHQDARTGDDLDHHQVFAPHTGYEVIPDSVQIAVISGDGEWGLLGNCSTTLQACWRVKTVQHHCVAFICPQGHDGAVNFKLSFSERILVPKTQSGQVDIPIDWNVTSLHTFPATGALSWTAVYTDFNNHAVPFGSSDTRVNSPFLKVKNVTGTTIAFSVYPFTTDAGSLFSIAPPASTPVPNGTIAVNVGKHPERIRSPLTREGFSALKAFAQQALHFPRQGLQAAPVSTFSLAAFVLQDANGTYRATIVSPTPAVSPAEQAKRKAFDDLGSASDDPL